MKILFLASSLLDLRKLTHSTLLDGLRGHEVVLMTTSADALAPSDREAFTDVVPMPSIEPARGWPYRALRRWNAAVWDQALDLACRRTLARSDLAARRYPYQYRSYRRWRVPARLVNVLGLRGPFERLVQATLERIDQWPPVDERLQQIAPDVVVSTATNRFEEPAIMGRAKRLGIRALTYIHSMDTLSVKGRLYPRYDGILVWSEDMRAQLHRFAPATRTTPVEIVGACQYDVFHEPRYRLGREAFATRHGLDPARPIVLYALGSPRFLDEAPGALALAGRLQAENPEGIQLLVRPHPQFDDGSLEQAFEPLADVARIQRVADTSQAFSRRAQDDARIEDWVSSVAHADVVVNTSSSFTVDAALLDRPIVNVNFAANGDADEDRHVTEITGSWEHFQPLVETGGLVLADDVAAVHAGIRAYLADPSLHRAERRALAELVCGREAGPAGGRVAAAILRLGESGRRSSPGS